MQSTKLIWILLLAGVTASASAQVTPIGASANSAVKLTGGLPLTFEVNQGQVDSQVKFVSRGKGYTAFLTAGGLVLALHSNPAAADQPATGTASGKTPPPATLQFNFLGANQNPVVVGEDPLSGRVNYFIGRDPSKWHTNVPTYGKVRYKNVYPGIDLVYYGNHRRLEYDFVISPGADPSKIQFKILGAKQIDLDADGNLVLQTTSGPLHFASPAIYLESNGTRIPVSGAYAVKDATHIGFQVNPYDQSKPLVIDPLLIYSTYLGGSGNDQPSGIAVDSLGNVYVAGFTDSQDFPLATVGSLPAGPHVFVAKLDPTGSNLIYADYIGGNSQDYGYALVLDSSNEVYVTGSTASSDFPVVNPYQGTYPGSFNGFLSKVSADGSSLLYSSYLGGNGSDSPAGIAIDSASDVLVAGNTTSTNFPAVNAYQTTASPNQGNNYGQYGFLTKFSPDGSYLVYSTYFAGDFNIAYNCGGTPCWPSPYSAITGIVVDGSGNAYVTGNTNTYNFPTTTGAYSTTNSTQQLNANVGFVSKFSSAGSLTYSTYLYESSGILSNLDAIAVDADGSAYVTGSAYSDGTFPITATAICDPGVYTTACGYAFVTKLDPTGAQLAYSTFLGPNNSGNPRAIAIDADKNAYVLASSTSSSFSLVNGIEPYSGGSDLLLVEIDPLASTEIFATYLGASLDEFAAGIAVDPNGNIYVDGTTDSSDFPVTQNAFQPLFGGNTDVFVMKIEPGSAPSVATSPQSLDYAAQTMGSTSQPQTVLLRNLGSSPLTISSITTTGDFAESDTCGTSVAAAGNCTLSVTFTPLSGGTRTGTVVIQDDASGSPQVITLTGTGNGPGATLSPASLSFSSQPIGTSSAAQAVSLTNAGNATLNVGTIQVTGDYTQVNNCPATLAANASCSINVTFTPTVPGTRSGTLTVNDNVLNTPQTINLTGIGAVGGAPVASLSPLSLTFPSQPVKTSATAQTVTLANTGNAALNVISIQTTGDFSQTNNCGAQLSPNATCAINVTFTPTASGTRSGILTVNDNGAGSPQTVALSGSGSDFSLVASPTSDTVKAGAVATFNLTVSPTGGSFASAVTLACSGLSAQTSCSFSPATVTPGSNAAKSTLSITTVATTANSSSRRGPVFAIFLQLPGIGFLGMAVLAYKARKIKYGSFGLPIFLAFALISMTACAGGTGTTAIPPAGTAPGTYTITVTATAGGLQHSMPLSLTVQ